MIYQPKSTRDKSLINVSQCEISEISVKHLSCTTEFRLKSESQHMTSSFGNEDYHIYMNKISFIK